MDSASRDSRFGGLPATGSDLLDDHAPQSPVVDTERLPFRVEPERSRVHPRDILGDHNPVRGIAGSPYGALHVGDVAGIAWAAERLPESTWPVGVQTAGRTIRVLARMATGRAAATTAVAEVRRFVALWEGADPELQPTVASARRQARDDAVAGG